MIGITRRVHAIVWIIAAASIAGCAHRVVGQPARAWELRGAIAAVTDEHLAIRHKTGQIVDLVIDGRTVVMHDEQRQARDALRQGRRVRVEVEPLADGSSLARIVRVYGRGS
jgi:hypothetical protein